ncbi:MAG: hypothetical protein QM796_16410 [Chthoniobacteraceae bacterium]
MAIADRDLFWHASTIIMNAKERLQAAHRAAMEGRHEEALTEYIWFHHHALQEDTAYYGVRLSFALGYWIELGESYPPALEALCEIRDKNLRLLESGHHRREIFHDFAVINDRLREREKTARLFQLLESQDLAFATKCAPLAMEALVEVGDFHRAAKYLPEPVARIAKQALQLNQDITDLPDHPRLKAANYRANVDIFVKKLRLIMTVLSGADRGSEAAACREAGLAALIPRTLRKKVERALEKGA